MAAAGGFADFLAASHISLNVGPASVSSEELTRSLSEATNVSRSSHFEVKAFFFRSMFSGLTSSLNLKEVRAG